MQRSGRNVQRLIVNVAKLGSPAVRLRGAFGNRRLGSERRRQALSHRIGFTGIVIDGHAEEMFALPIAVDKTCQGTIGCVCGGRLQTVLEVIGEDRRAVGEVIPQVSAFQLNLVEAVKQRHTYNANG
jgi:hypothetical protein